MPEANQQEAGALEGQEVQQTANINADNQNTEANEQTQLDPVEALAVEFGWKPASEWKGDKSKHVGAADYLRGTQQKLQERDEKLRDATQRLRAKDRERDEYALRMERLERTTSQMMSEQETRLRDEISREFEAAKKAAAKAGDDAQYDKLIEDQRKAEAQLEQRFKQPAVPDPDAIAQQMLADPVVGKFWKEHAWVAEDDEAFAFATDVAQKMADAGYPAPIQIREVKRALREEFPDRFEAPRRETRDPANEGQTVRDPETGQFVPKKDAHIYQQQPQRKAPIVQSGTRMSGKQTPEQEARASLPPEALRVFEEQSKAGRFKGDIVKYAKMYRGEKFNVLD